MIAPEKKEAADPVEINIMDFNFIAPAYAILERVIFGGSLQRARIAHLDSMASVLPHQAGVLVAGDGDGRFVVELVKRRPDLIVDFVELSEGMLKRAKARVGSIDPAPQIRWFQQDVRESQGENYDMIVTHFFLDCFDEDSLPSLVETFHQKLRPAGYWVCSDFDPSVGWWAKALVRTMYFFFQQTTGLATNSIVSTQPLFEQRSMLQLESYSSNSGFIYSTLWQRP